MTACEKAIPGDLILSYEDTFASRVVRFFTKSEWSHVGVYDEDGLMISAVPFHGVSRKQLCQVKNYAIYRVKEIDLKERAEVIDFCTRQLGRPYDFVQILLLGYRIITDGLHTAEGDPNPDSYVCSELVAEAYSQVGIYFGKIVDNVLPETIAAASFTELVARS